MAIVTAKQGLSALHWALEKGADLSAPHPAPHPASTAPAPPAPATAPTAVPPRPMSADMALTAEKSEHVRARVLLAVAALVIVLGGLAIIAAVVHDPTYGPRPAAATPVQGLTIFAVFFVTASAIERLLEPVSRMLPSATDKKAEAESKLAGAGQTVLATAHGTPPPEHATTLEDAASALDDAQFRNYWKSLLMWTLATLIAMLASAFMKLYMLRTVGISNGPRPVEILATGLIVGSGTKPLHDLVTLVSNVNRPK